LAGTDSAQELREDAVKFYRFEGENFKIEEIDYPRTQPSDRVGVELGNVLSDDAEVSEGLAF